MSADKQQELLPKDGASDQADQTPGSPPPITHVPGGAGPAEAAPNSSQVAPTRTSSPVVGDGEVLVPVTDYGSDASELSKETLIPVSGMVRLSARELELISHPAFQRLFEIYQLGQTNLVYRGATHMRGEHAIGSLHTITAMIEALKRNACNARGESPQSNEHWCPANELSPEETAFTRLGALLHDIGHLPAGHTLEDELGLLPRHDADERINMVLDRCEWHGRAYPSLRALIDKKYAQEAAGAAQVDETGQQLTASQLLVLLVSSNHKDAEMTEGSDFRVGVCRDLIGNTICADLLDYLHRDWMHLGKPRYFDSRLLDYLEVLTRERADLGREDRLAINMKGAPRPRPDAVTAILDLLESRYQLAEIALFHRVKLSAAGMLERVIAEYRDTFANEDEQREALAGLLPDLLECSDLEMPKLFERKLLERRSRTNAKRVDGALDLIRRLRVRQLHHDLHILYEDDIGGPEAAMAIATRFSGDPSLVGEQARADVRRAAEDRLRAVRTLERDFDLRPGDIVMYCPSLQMNTKIAEVNVYLNGLVDSLAKLDERNSRISGGHLAAQQERFRRLWRVSFAIDRDAFGRLEADRTLRHLRETIENAVLWIPSWQSSSATDAVREIAEDMTKLPASPWFGHPIAEPALNRGVASVEYPGGAPSLTSFIAEKQNATKGRRSG